MLTTRAVSLLFLSATLLSAQSEPELFSPVVTYSLGGYPAGQVAVADLNGDGWLDLLVTNQGASQDTDGRGVINVLLGNGDGTFRSAVAYGSGGLQANSVAVADVNGDGRPDLLVVNQCADNNGICGADGTVGVLLGNGDGTFRRATTYDSGGFDSYSVAVADVNGDGKPDLLVTNFGGVAVLLGNGDGTFQEAVTYESGGIDDLALVAADVNADGKPDLIVTNSSGVAVLLGNGNGTFQKAVTYKSGGVNALALAVADVNEDGKPDLIVTNSRGVAVLLGNGNGTFRAGVAYDSGGRLANSIAVADVNGDGRPDLVVANQCGNTSKCANGSVSVLLGNGDGTFQAAAAYDSGGHLANSIAVGDVNGDGKLDVLVANGCAGNAECSNGLVGLLLGKIPNQYRTTTTLTSSLNPCVYGQNVIFTATVNSSNGPPPDGEIVTFKRGSHVLGTAALGGGVATLSVQALFFPHFNVVAFYPGDASFSKSQSPTLNQKVNQASTTTVLYPPSPSPASFGEAVTFAGQILPEFAGTGTPYGLVVFNNGAEEIGEVTTYDGSYTFTTQTLALGTYNVTATYSHEHRGYEFEGSTSNALATAPLVVSPAATTTTLTSSLNPSDYKQAVTFTADVAGQFGGKVTGTVTFMDGSTILKTANVYGGVATFRTSTLTVGSHTITATYNGSTNFYTSSAELTQVVQ